MRKLIAAAVLAVVAVVSGVSASPATASTHHAVVSYNDNSRRCTVNYDWRANAPAGVTAVDLEVNTCNDTIQDRTQCRSITSGALYYTYSGETNRLEANEGATCVSFDTAVAGAIQYPDGQTWHTYWVV